MSGYYKTLQTQRFDDYRYYHQSRINQTLHLISAVIFLVCYALLFKDPAMAGLVGWLAMLTRQTGHFFFEPNGYDHVNDVTNDYKEAAEPASRMDFVRHVGLLWLAVGIGGGLFRMIQLFATQDVATGLIWGFKVLSDPLHNIALYWKSPLALLRGELIDPTIKDASHWGAAADESESEEAAHLT